MAILFVDKRWVGNHGIGRYSQEILHRMSLPHSAIAGSPPKLTSDWLYSQRLRLPATGVIYSPGFNAGLTRATQVVTVHDLIHLQAGSQAKYGWYYEKILRPAVTKAGVVLTVSNTSRNAIREWLGVDERRVEVINAGNACAEIFLHEESTFEAPFEYFIAVTNPRPHKNLRTLLEAVASLGTHVRLMIVTNEPRGVAELVRQQGVTSRVIIKTAVSDRALAGLYRGAIANVFPSLCEGYGYPIAEASAAGVRNIYAGQCRAAGELAAEADIMVTRGQEPEEWAQALELAMLSDVRRLPRRAAGSWERVAAAVQETLAGRIAIC